MSAHNKMASDYIWVRHAPIQEGTKFRNFGFHYLYNRAPNRVERLEMIYRSLGKEFDWQLQKFRSGRKSVDRGNKRRFFRNTARFIKHPIGYISWALHNYMTAAMPRFLVVMATLTFASALYEWKTTSNKLVQHDQLLMSYGKNIEGMSGRYTGFHNTYHLTGPILLDMMFRTPISHNQIIISPSWKGNLRKELQLTNAEGVEF